MPITEEQRRARRRSIGSSDMAAILGLDPYKTAYDVWLEKAGKLIDTPDEPSAVMVAGNRFESGVLDFAEEKLGPLERNVTYGMPEIHMVTNIDAVTYKGELRLEPVEGKTAGLFGPLTEWWGDEGTDQVPDRVIVQGHVHMIAMDAQVCYVATFLGGRGFAMFHVPRNEKIVSVIGEQAIHFWKGHVEPDIPPEESTPSLQVVKLMKRSPDSIASIDPDLILHWLALKGLANEANEAVEDAQALILAALGDAEAGLCGQMGAITYYESNRKGYTVEPTTFRVLRHKKKGL